ncbi:S1C family serine protease [Nitrospira sp. KM1]|uniref:S1C family serine protease n=1 Tax=Nitrospira sp. KM1 TaxID=1936990 RepID=UPI0015669FD3|nr:trypsin-like peptidase domain-containing protein [Nitrospira sp. KM1]
MNFSLISRPNRSILCLAFLISFGGSVSAFADPGPIVSAAADKSLSVPAVVNKVRPSVVTILTRGMPAAPSQNQSGSGSGVIIDQTGYILTNNHLVAGVKSIVVGLSTGRLTPGRVVARDFLLDLALVRINAQDLVPATLSPSPALEIGESVVAIGNPLALKGGSTVTVGVVSALDRSVLTPDGETLYDLIQTDAAINPGNSGGPLVDLSGRVVGINVAIAPSAQAISYAISMDAVYPHIESMIVRGSIYRPDLGFTPLTVSPSLMASLGLEGDRGVLALKVDTTQAAGMGGLQEGDVITAVDQHQIYNMGDFWHALLRNGDQSAVQLTLQRKNGQLTIHLPKPSQPRTSP